MSKQVADALREARKLIDEPGKWCQGRLRDGNGRHCALAATHDVPGVTGPMTIRMHNALTRALPVEWRVLPYFNDNPATTWEDIMALYDRAIAAEDATP